MIEQRKLKLICTVANKMKEGEMKVERIHQVVMMITTK